MARTPATPPPPHGQQPTDDAEKKAKAKRRAKRRAKRAKLRAELRLFKFREKQTDHAVHTASIICAISTAQGIMLYTVEEGKMKIYSDINRSLASMKRLRELGFLRIHGSVVLNMAHYRGMTKTRQVTLSHSIDRTLHVSVRLVPDVNRFLDRHCY